VLTPGERERTVEGRLQRYAEILQAEYDAIHARAAVIKPEELADLIALLSNSIRKRKR
jgi:hypothetical protein